MPTVRQAHHLRLHQCQLLRLQTCIIIVRPCACVVVRLCWCCSWRLSTLRSICACTTVISCGCTTCAISVPPCGCTIVCPSTWTSCACVAGSRCQCCRRCHCCRWLWRLARQPVLVDLTNCHRAMRSIAIIPINRCISGITVDAHDNGSIVTTLSSPIRGNRITNGTC